MIGTHLIERLVQAVAVSHRVRGHKRVSLLLLAAPESGKTTIASAAASAHVCRVAMITGRSILREVKDNPQTEFLLFNDLTAVRAMSAAAVNLLILILNQFTQDERGVVAFAGKETEQITRPIGIIGCLPFQTFKDHRARWREMGFVSRMIPFAYSYGRELVAEIKDSIDDGSHEVRVKTSRKELDKFSKKNAQQISLPQNLARQVRRIADARAAVLGQAGIRLLQNYHCLIRAHALLHGRVIVNDDDLSFLRSVDAHVSIDDCRPLALEKPYGKAPKAIAVRASTRSNARPNRIQSVSET